MKIGIAGIGGIGSNVARHLVQGGVTTLKVVDHDRVEPTNLNRQFYTLSQVGELKTESLKHNLQEIAAQVVVECVQRKLGPGDCTELFADCDIVVEGFDDRKMKKQLVEELAGVNKIVVSASGIAGDAMAITTRRVGCCHVVGDFVSDQEDNTLFPPKVAMVAATMAGIVLHRMREVTHER